MEQETFIIVLTFFVFSWKSIKEICQKMLSKDFWFKEFSGTSEEAEMLFKFLNISKIV